jgi:hypothetical protein
LVIAITVLRGSIASLPWLVWVMCAILIGAADSCWNLLLDLAMAKRHRDEQQTS